MGGGHLRINIFGRTDTERVQVTDLSLASPLTNIYLDINHPENELENYTRALVLNDATAHVKYTYQDIIYEREYLASYPDALVAVKLWASDRGKITLTLRADAPCVTAEGDSIAFSGKTELGGAHYAGQIKVLLQGGNIRAAEGKLEIEAADTAVILITGGANHHDRAITNLDEAAALGYTTILDRHISDYYKYFNRMSLDLGGQPANMPVDKLLESYKNGAHDPYLEELYFQYGRYLLILATRTSTLPDGGRNVNDYGPAFTTNILEEAEIGISDEDAHSANMPEVAEIARDGEGAYNRLQALIKEAAHGNLIQSCPLAQANGNYGGTAVVAEMLLQSDGNIIEPLPTLPASWGTGSYMGLVARGNFVVNCIWENSKIKQLVITARAGGACRIRYPGIALATVKSTFGTDVPTAVMDDDLEITMIKSGIYTIEM